MRVAILTPITHPSLETIERGFIQTLREDESQSYHFTTYNAQGNKTLMRSEVEEIIRKDFDLVFAIGTSVAQMTSEVFTKKGIEIPVVFTVVNDPVGFMSIRTSMGFMKPRPRNDAMPMVSL